ncbi:MAG: 16S rRNA (guanine(966)-N(2))-methyltransferase RsmD [Lentisphaeria bacterium]|nr:16S rRNA (guanine(966)-N(2))-methyltransferase RsmD [Lentisphaeria bacterium]
MRIISGRAGGIRLSAPAGRSLRPTEDRVKESMFSTLGDLTGATVIDLFAGTGALGLEALSRGADRVFLVENNREHCQYITRNLAAVLKALGNPTRADAGTARVITADARQAATVLADIRPDVLLADPPYHQDSTGFGAAHLLADASLAAWAGPECLLVLEHAADAILPWHPQSPWRLLKDKRFGIRAVSFARLAQ